MSNNQLSQACPVNNNSTNSVQNNEGQESSSPQQQAESEESSSSSSSSSSSNHYPPLFSTSQNDNKGANVVDDKDVVMASPPNTTIKSQNSIHQIKKLSIVNDQQSIIQEEQSKSSVVEQPANKKTHSASPSTTSSTTSLKHYIDTPDKMRQSSEHILKKCNIIALDCQGVRLGRYGQLCLIQIFDGINCYIIDALALGRQTLTIYLNEIFSSLKILKIMHDCCEDSAALYHQTGIFLRNVFDTQIAYELAHLQSNISLKEMLLRTVNFTHINKENVSSLMQQNQNLWKQRPIHTELIKYACDDVVALLKSYEILVEELSGIKNLKISEVIDRTQKNKVNYCLLNTGLELNQMCVYHEAIIDGLVKCVKAERGFVFVALNLGIQGRVTDYHSIAINCTGANPRYREGDWVKFQIVSDSVSYSLGSLIELKFWNEHVQNGFFYDIAEIESSEDEMMRMMMDDSTSYMGQYDESQNYYGCSFNEGYQQYKQISIFSPQMMMQSGNLFNPCQTSQHQQPQIILAKQANTPPQEQEKENNDHRLKQRQKQIDFGKNTRQYKKYLRTVQKIDRQQSKRDYEHPVTPDKYKLMSKRKWDNEMRQWRRLLHEFYDEQHQQKINIGKKQQIYSSGNLYKLKNGGDISDKNMVAHLRKKSIKEGMVKHSFSGCEGEDIKYHRKKANNYKSMSSNSQKSYYNNLKFIPTALPPTYNQSYDAINSQYHQYYHQYSQYQSYEPQRK